MKKIFLSLAFLLSAVSMMADTFKVASLVTEAGITNEDYDHQFEITLDNEVADNYTAFQFKIFLPEGMDILDEAAGFEFDSDRFEGVTRKGVFTAQHAVQVCSKMKDGSYLVAVADPKLSKIHGTSGTVLYVYYTTSGDFKGGEISIKEQVLVVDGNTKVAGDDFVGNVATGIKGANADEASAKANKFMTKKGLVITKGNKKYNAAAQEIK